MNITIEIAKNASPTCVVDGRFLHSKYNPENEAKSFAHSLECNFSPSCIIITGASLPYTLPYFQERFPATPIYAIQYNVFFMKYAEWADSFLCTEESNIEEISENIFSRIGETQLSAALIVAWNPSKTIFEKEHTIAWNSLKLALQKSRDIIATRSYFTMRWLKNSVRFCTLVQNIVLLKKQEKQILLVASGFSLQKSLSYIQKYKNDFFIIAVSSAISPLTENNIIPDLCISTDGGFYAKNHLEKLIELHKKGIAIPLAISCESNVPAYILENCPIVPLTYGDGIESTLLDVCKIPALKAERNGTVSGTASLLALELTNKNVYACGLDLSSGKGYSHCLPNAHEKIHSQKDFKLKPLELRICPKPQNNVLTPMDIYRQWFETRNDGFTSRFFRLSLEPYTKNLGNIKDILWKDITSKKYTQIENTIINKTIPENNNRKKILCKFLDSLKENDYIHDIAYGEYIAAKKYPDSIELQNKLTQTLTKRITELKDLCL